MTSNLAKQFTLKELQLSRFQNPHVFASLLANSKISSQVKCNVNSILHVVDSNEMNKVKNSITSIPINQELTDCSSLLKVQDSVSTSTHNYTFKFKINDGNLPTYFKRQSGLTQLFPNRDIQTYLSVIQHTVFDQSVFTAQTHVEREILARNFVGFASLLVEVLKVRFNAWADFVDPTSGTGFFESNGKGFISETDEILVKQAGLTVRDLGCCRVLASLEWGTRVWLGSFVSSASQQEVLEAIHLIVNHKTA